MPDPVFRWISCTDKRRPHEVGRPPGVALRLAQITDMHMPGEISLGGRLRDLMAPRRKLGNSLSHHISAIANELSHSYRSQPGRLLFLRLFKKALIGLRRLHVDHLVITGDLTHCGLPTEFLDVRAALEVTGWLDPSRLTVIAGNHDRFNLYESLVGEPMEAFFDVVDRRHPRLKLLDGPVALIEIDSNRDPIEDAHPSERWLPNVIGKIQPEVLDWMAHPSQRQQIAGRRLVVLVHHHMSTDWYLKRANQNGLLGLMAPLPETTQLLDAASLSDRDAIFLHGHKHDPMAIDYRLGRHRLANPGGFATTLRINLVDFEEHGEETLTQIGLRT